MVFDRGGFVGDKMISLLFLAFALLLTISSLFYADWYQKNVTGFTAYECNPDEGEECYVPPTEDSSSSSGSSSPSAQELDDASKAGDTSASLTKEVLDMVSKYVPESSITSLTDSGTTASSTGSGTDAPTTGSGTTASSTGSGTTTNTCASFISSVECRNTLQDTQMFILSSISETFAKYIEVIKLDKKYPYNFQIEKNKKVIEDSLTVMQSTLNVVDLYLSKTTVQIQDRQWDIAQSTIDYANSVANNVVYLDDYINKYGSKTPALPAGSVLGETDCLLAVDLVLFRDRVDFGDIGVNDNGEKCYMDISKPVLAPAVSQSSSLTGSGLISSVNSFSHSSGGGGASFFIENQGQVEGGTGQVEAFTAAFSPNGNIFLGFFSASNTFDLNKKINDFVGRVVSGLGGESLSGRSASAGVSSEISERSVPWFLWAALVSLIIPFLFFNKFMLPFHERLAREGRIALQRGDFASAVGKYKQMVDRYRVSLEEHDDNVKQEILSYFILLKAGLRAANIYYDIDVSKDKLPYIVFSHGNNPEFVVSDYQRVEKMLQDSLRDLEKFPGQMIQRAHLIAKMYSQLNRSDREKLASLYERFVYGLRNAKS